jgi:hypothetical protein
METTDSTTSSNHEAPSYPTVERLNAEDLDRAELRREYLAANRPVVIHCPDAWPEGILSPNLLRDRYGNMPLRDLRNGPGGSTGLTPADFERFDTLGSYLTALEQADETGPPTIPYVTNLSLRLNFPEVARTFRPATDVFGMNYLGRNVAGEEMFIGPPGSTYGELHFDRFHMFVASYQLFGRKKWWVFPPEDRKYLYPTTYGPDWYPQLSPIDPAAPDLERYPLFSQTHGAVAVLEPGDVLFCPAMWWHTTCNQSASISVAIRMVNRFNVLPFVGERISLGIAYFIIAKKLRQLGTSWDFGSPPDDDSGANGAT